MHYTGIIWRPPYEADSLLLEVTAGCTHHSCKFCTLYDDLPFKFRMSPLGDVEADLQEAQMWAHDPMAKLSAGLFDMQGRPKVERVFLVGANPFVLSFDRLMKIARLVRKYFPAVKSIGSFARITDITPKTDEELAQLAAAGYDGLTIGIETGDDEALRFMNKGYESRDILLQCRRLEQAGIGYNFFYLVGVSGAGRGVAGAQATAQICNRLRPERLGANMLTIYPESALYLEIQQGNWQEEAEIEKYIEMKTLAEHLTIPVWFGAMGASNPIQIQCRLPEDKEDLLRLFDKIIAETDEDELREYRQNLPHL